MLIPDAFISDMLTAKQHGSIFCRAASSPGLFSSQEKIEDRREPEVVLEFPVTARHLRPSFCRDRLQIRRSGPLSWSSGLPEELHTTHRRAGAPPLTSAPQRLSGTSGGPYARRRPPTCVESQGFARAVPVGMLNGRKRKQRETPRGSLPSPNTPLTSRTVTGALRRAGHCMNPGRLAVSFK